MNNIMKDYDSESFQILKYSYTKDKNNVYFLDRKLENVDPDTFEILNSHDARDKTHTYKDGILQESIIPKESINSQPRVKVRRK